MDFVAVSLGKMVQVHSVDSGAELMSGTAEGSSWIWGLCRGWLEGTSRELGKSRVEGWSERG